MRLMLAVCVLFCSVFSHAATQPNYVIEEYVSDDLLKIIADYYEGEEDKPLFVAFHRPTSSRGEFIDIATRLKDKGYSLLAVDLRAGGIAHGRQNLTYQHARMMNKSRRYIDGYLDMSATLDHVKKKFPNKEVYIIASSYNSILAMKLAVEHSVHVDALFLLSPATFTNAEPASRYSPNVYVPTWVTSDVGDQDHAAEIFEQLGSVKKEFFISPNDEPAKGARILDNSNPNADFHWNSMMGFIRSLND